MILKLSSNSTHSVNKLLEILCLTDNMCPSLFFSETLMLLEPRPAAAELCTAQEQRAERQEKKSYDPLKPWERIHQVPYPYLVWVMSKVHC